MNQRKIKSRLSKVNFFIGNSPKIEKAIDYRKYIPEHNKSVLLISADFELAWAWRYTKSSSKPFEKAIDKADIERQHIPKIVALCEKYKIPITQATVGHLFLKSCEKKNGIPHAELPRIPHFQNDFWKYSGKDWFEYDPCTNEQKDPAWYGTELIEMIVNSSIDHEIACHTFSHIDCRDSVCPPEVFKAEVQKCLKIAEEWNLKLKSFVHPGHTIGNLDLLSKEGFTNFRTDYRNVLGYPKRHTNGLWEFEQTAEFSYRKEWSIEYHIQRYIKIIKRAIKSNTVCVLWFHPSFDEVFITRIWPEVFRFINENKDKLWITTHSEYVAWLEEHTN